MRWICHIAIPSELKQDLLRPGGRLTRLRKFTKFRKLRKLTRFIRPPPQGYISNKSLLEKKIFCEVAWKLCRELQGCRFLWVIIFSGMGLFFFLTQLPLTHRCSSKSPQHTCWFTKLVLCRSHSLACQYLVLGGLMFLHVLLGSHMQETWIWVSPMNKILLKTKQ